MVDRVYCLSLTKAAFSTKCNKLRTMFSKLCNRKEMIYSDMHRFSMEKLD